MAAQVANPQDLLSPRAETPIDPGGARPCSTSIAGGEVTSSAKDEQSNGVVSKAVN